MSNETNYNVYFENALTLSRKTSLTPALINRVLNELAAKAIEQADYLLAANKKDLDKMDESNPNYDRLKLTLPRIQNIARDIINVSKLENPLGHLLSEKTMPNGLNISKISVPLGIVGVIYEARPNVTFDVFCLCLKSGNICVLKGGSDAVNSNRAIMSVIHTVLDQNNIDRNIVTLLPAERAATNAMFNAIGYIDVLIPRGSQNLINHVRQNSKVPIIETGAGIVHTYFDEFGGLDKATNIVFNAKTRRVSVCNALDCLIIHSSRLNDLVQLAAPLGKAGVELFVDEPAYKVLEKHYPANILHKANNAHYGTEFLSMKMAVKTVDTFEQALDHIAIHSSKHSEAIISENAANIEAFLNRVDAAAVYVNTSTAFTDGAQFGLGAEIGISTQKLHARGPMGLQELTSYKWIVKGNGQVRN